MNASGRCVFSRDDGLGESKALPAFRLVTEVPIGAARGGGALLHRLAKIAFFYGITDTNDHVGPPERLTIWLL